MAPRTTTKRNTKGKVKKGGKKAAGRRHRHQNLADRQTSKSSFVSNSYYEYKMYY